MAYKGKYTPLSILVVENDTSLRETLQEMLELKGFRVETASDGQVALSVISSRHFDMVLTDLHMPKLNGLELLESISQKKPDVTRVLMSSQFSRDIKSYARQIGVYANLDKPFLSEKLFSIIEHSLQDSCPAGKKAGKRTSDSSARRKRQTKKAKPCASDCGAGTCTHK